MDWLGLPFVRPVFGWIRSQLGISREHDVTVFSVLNTIADESRLDNVLNSSIYTSHLKLPELQILEDFARALERTENCFLHDTVQMRAAELHHALTKLLDLVRETFFAHGDVLKFYPHPIDKKLHDTKWSDLNKGIDNAWQAYEVYRKAVKQYLRV